MIKAAIAGYGNIGKYVFEALICAKDFEIAGVISEHADSKNNAELAGIQIVKKLSGLKIKPDVAILCRPSRDIPEIAEECLKSGLNTVDSFDIHQNIAAVREKLDKAAKESGKVSILSAGWDPGSDSVVRALIEIAAPKGITYTNFGPGMSMGHSAAVKAIKGVKNSLSMTIPSGASVHRRMVYIEIEDGYNFDEIAKKIKSDEYFVHDETHVIKVDDVDALKDTGHGVHMVRKGVSGKTHNQIFEFKMKINNPALTAQILVAAARASMKQQPGCYTMIEIPMIDMLYGDKEELIRKLV
ncbi:MAG: diaminopimelate dehydrogenase [Endomicrobia bacterium]|nr:diaminopimelate dehydrogenase [Endomicrobiia bacterium]MCL2145269.1 diaminopimelate dehydrogenase [Endomicrobiia bacterium]